MYIFDEKKLDPVIVLYILYTSDRIWIQWNRIFFVTICIEDCGYL